MMKYRIKLIINKILQIFNLKLIKNKHSGVIDKRILSPFQNYNRKYNLYFEGLKKSQNLVSDNFFKQSRHLDLMNLAEITLKKNITGDFAEAGCWRGHSSFLLSKLITENNQNKIKFHIFDSFKGLSDNLKEDNYISKLSVKQKNQIKSQFVSDEKFVKEEVLGKFDFVKIYKGWIPERFKEVENSKFSFVHIDVDLFEPTLNSLEFFFPRLSDGGIIVCDDYNSLEFDGAKKAWDKFFLNKKVSLNFAPSLGSSFIIK